MNDGIYMPFDEDRFQKCKDGITWLHDTVVKSGARIIHLTPPYYNELKGKKYVDAHRKLDAQFGLEGFALAQDGVRPPNWAIGSCPEKSCFVSVVKRYRNHLPSSKTFLNSPMLLLM